MLHIHENFISEGPQGYNGNVIAEFELENDNTLECIADEKLGVFWINEFQPDGFITDRKFDTSTTYDQAIELIVKEGEKINKE